MGETKSWYGVRFQLRNIFCHAMVEGIRSLKEEFEFLFSHPS